MPLTANGLDLGSLEQRVRAIEHSTRRVGVAGLRLRHHPRGQVHRVAHDRVRAAVGTGRCRRRTPRRGDADPDRQRQLGVEDAAHGEQHALLVVARDLRRAGRQDQLAAVDVDVRGEQRDVLRLGRRFDDAAPAGAARRPRPAMPCSAISASMPS